MENKNLTVWQRLSHAFGPNAMLNQDVPTYKFDKKELLRTQDKNDFERQRLQAQQTFYLSNQWSKIDNHLYTQAIYYEPSRLASVYDFEAMEYSLFAETKIATPDGFYTIKELADKGRDYEFITYAYDHNLKKVVPAKAYNAHYTRDEMTYKITFDDNSHIIATYGHRFLKRDGVFCEVENLQIGDSMMPFYRKSFYNNQNYNWVYTCNKNEGHHGWVKEDVLMAELNPKELNERTFITSKLIPWDLLVETAKKEKSMRNVSIVLGISIYELISKIQVGGFNDWSTFMEAYGLDVPNEKIESDEVLVNHKIISIEPYGVVPVYDLTVPGYKNFATDTIFSHNTPEIGAALDIYAEESTTTDENGFMLQIYSESKRIKSVLTDLFNNVLDINTNLPMWTRNTVKFGDNFIYLKLDPEKGIVGCNQLPNIEIERLEPGGEDKTVSQSTNKVINDSLKFRWKNKTMEFQPWEVAHFRILGDDRKLPYGTCLKYDSKIDTEFGIKEIKDVQKGDLVWSFDLNTEQKVLSKVLDTVNSGIKTCYQIHTKHNFIEASKEHKILIYKNNEFIYKNVLDLEIGDCLVIDNTKGQVKEIQINKSKPNENKNGWFNCIDLVPDFVDEEFARFFGFMIGDGWISGNSVYFALSEYDDLNDFYIGILNKYSKNPVKIIEVNGRETQCLVNSKSLKTVMERMGFVGNAHTKRLPEWVYYSDIKIQKALLEGLIDADGWITQDKWSTHLNIELCNQDLVKDVKILCQKIGYKSGSIRKREPRKNVIIEGRSIKSSNPSFSLTFYDTLLAQTKKHDNDKRKSEDYILEPINKIIEIGEFETHDIYVENENHNFYANGVVVHNSMLEKARRIWKQLLLAEDAMLIYRTSRAPERRVFKVFVGNMDDNDVEAYVNRVANKFKREQVVDSKTGNVDMRYNQMAVDQDYFVPVRDPSAPSPIETLPGACISLDTRIPLLDGRVLELNKIIEEWDNGNRNLWAYSCDPTTGDLAPGLITWAGVTRKDTNVLKITLDNGEQVITTPDHKFVHRTNGFVEAQNLKVGDSLMPFYTRESKINSSKSKYHQVWNNKTKKWNFTHRMVANFMKGMNQHTEFVYNDKLILEDKKTIHHLDIDRYNNTPNNLTFMNNKDHYDYHSNNINVEHCRLGGEALKNKLLANPELKEAFIKMKSISSKEMWSKRTKEEIEIISKKQSNGLKKYIQSLNEDEKNYRYSKNIHSPEAKTKTLNKLLTWCENLENRKKKGILISKTKQLRENKTKASELAKKNWESSSYRDKVFSKPQKLIFNDLLFNMFVDTTKKFNTVSKILNSLNNNSIFMLEFYNLNKDIRSSLVNLTVFTENNLNKLLKQFGYLNWKSWKGRALNNHKITSIEILGETMDTGTITIDGNEIYHNYHTFAIESGIFIKNSNLGDIADIEYIQKKLVTALRIPKSFLGFEEVVGDGKTLSIQDIRFARTINRIQKCMLAELNKIAIVHLFLLGFEDEISNFTLGLTNPSVQSDLLKIDVWKEKIMLYRDAVSDPGSGVAAVSATWAKKHIFGFSDEEIRLDLQQQRIERAVGQELLNTALVIKKTGLFDNIDKLYGEVSGATTGQNAAAAPGEMGSSSMSSGGLDMGGLDMGGLDMGGEESAEGAPPPPPPLPNESPAEPGLAAESKLTNLNILVESNMIDGSSYIPLTKGQNSLGAINDELKKLLNL